MALARIASSPDKKKVNAGTFYLDYPKTNSAKDEIIKQLNTISASFNQIGKLCDSAVKNGTVLGAAAIEVKKLGTNIKKQGSYVSGHVSNIKNKLNADLTKQKEETLNKRINELERLVAQLQAKLNIK